MGEEGEGIGGYEDDDEDENEDDDEEYDEEALRRKIRMNGLKEVPKEKDSSLEFRGSD